MVGRMYYCVKRWIENKIECLPSIQVDSQCEEPYSKEDQRSLKEKENHDLVHEDSRHGHDQEFE